MTSPRYGLIALALAGVIAVIVAYYPGLHGPFVFDDEVNITANPRVNGTSQSNALPVAPSTRPLAVSSFAMNARLAGGVDDAFPFKVTNLAIHLLNALLVGWLVWLLLIDTSKGSRAKKDAHAIWAPPIIAILWALHPLQLTSVLYVVQRMTSLSTMFVLLGLIGFVYGRYRLLRKQDGGLPIMMGSLVGFSVIGFLAKENAVLLVPYALVIEYTFFNRTWAKTLTRRDLYISYGSAAGVVFLLGLIWLLTRHDSLLDVYPLRSFTLVERLLTEPRVLWFYVSLIVYPDVRRLSLFHDDLPASVSLWQPWTTVPAILGLALVIVAAIRYREKYPLLSFAILWFLVGHSLEASFVGLELVHEHRNYLAILGPIAATVVGLSQLIHRVRSAAPIFGLLATVAVCLTFATHARANIWSSERELVQHLITHHPNSERANAMLADFYYLHEGEVLPSIHHYLVAADINQHETAYLIRTTQIASLAGDSQRQPGSKLAEIRGRGTAAMVTIFRNSDGSTYLRPTLALRVLISQRLQSQPIHARTAQSLQELAGCALSQPGCRYLLAAAIRWHELAIANTRTNNSIRLPLLTQLVQLQLEDGQMLDARRTSQLARMLAPEQPVLALMHANVELLLGNVDEAEKLLQLVRQRRDAISDEQWQEAEKLLDVINAKRRRR